MAVYTAVAADDAAALLRRLGLGELRRLDGIRSGIENTNYFVDSSQGRWVLTLFERLGPHEVPYFLGLMEHLAAQGLPVPRPMPDGSGHLLHQVAGKPAALVTRLDGSPIDAPDVAHTAQLGTMLGRLHRAALQAPVERPHGHGLAWWTQAAQRVQGHLEAETRSLLQAELAFQTEVASSAAAQGIPRGAIHADLFRDNVLFAPASADGADTISGLLDFYFAGTEALLFDVAVCLNDWCVDASTGRLVEERAAALTEAYQAERPWAHGEWRLLPAMLRAAALRFWLSRLCDWHLPRPASLLEPKPPEHFERILRERIAQPWLPPKT